MDRKNNGNFLLGLIFIVVGGLWIAGSFGLIELSVAHLLLKFWSVLLILVGINIISKGNKGILLITVLLALAGVSFVSQNLEKFPNFDNFSYNGDFNWGDDDIELVSDSYDLEEVETANLVLDFGAGSINVGSTEGNQMLYEVPDYNLSRSMKVDNGNATITFKHNKGFHLTSFKENNLQNFDFKLPTNVLWRFKIDAGATDTVLDFSELKVASVDADAGVSDCTLIFGDLNDYTKVDIDTGVSDFNLKIKEGVGVQVKASQAISDNNFKSAGLIKSGSTYETKNFSKAENKIEIDSAVSDIRIEFY